MKKFLIILSVALVGILFVGLIKNVDASTMEGSSDRGYSAPNINYNTEPQYKGVDRNGMTWEERQKQGKDAVDFGNLPVLDMKLIFRMGNYTWIFPVYAANPGGTIPEGNYYYYDLPEDTNNPVGGGTGAPGGSGGGPTRWQLCAAYANAWCASMVGMCNIMSPPACPY